MLRDRFRAPRASALKTVPLLVLLALASPAAASARPAGERAAHAQERAARIEERVAVRQQRRAARLQQRATRAAERAQRRSARHNTVAGEGPSGSEETTAPETPTGESNPPSPSPTGGGGGSVTSSRGCTLSIETSAARIIAGENVTIFGKVSCPTGSNAGDRQVTIEQSPRDGAPRSFQALGTATSESDGSYQLPPLTLQANAVFRARLGRRGAHTSVRVAPAVTLSAPSLSSSTATPSSVGPHSHQARRSSATFSGTATPAPDGTRVALQLAYAADGEQWRTVAYGHLVGGQFSISHSFKIPGQAQLRVIVHPKGTNAPGVSEAVSYTVPAPQSPQLTIAASVDPIVSAQSITLSGIAAGADSQTVTLLARSAGGSFAPVETTTTDASGNYSFTQAPTQSTYYEVSDAATHSIALFEGVKHLLTLATPPSAIAAGQPLSLAGSVSPTHAGSTVYLERRGASGIGFHAIASATVNPDGTFTIAHTFENAANATLRVRVGADPQNLGSASAPFVLAVSAAAASALSPEASAIS